MRPRWGQKEAPEPLRKTYQKRLTLSACFGPQNRPQNRSKSTPKLDPFLDHFLNQFWAAFGDLLGAIWPQDWPGRDLEERAKWSSERPKRRLSKKWFTHGTVCIFSLLRPQDGPKRPRRLPKSVSRELRSQRKEPLTRT